MRSSSTATYKKLNTCPTAETLLRFARGGAGGRIESHVAACDFCGGEMLLLARLPARDEAPAAARSDIPPPLLRLAEKLLRPRPGEAQAHARPRPEAERLTLTDA